MTRPVSVTLPVLVTSSVNVIVTPGASKDVTSAVFSMSSDPFCTARDVASSLSSTAASRLSVAVAVAVLTTVPRSRSPWFTV